MFLDLTGQRILVTGGSGGIGRAIVELFATQGGEVHYTHRGNLLSGNDHQQFNSENKGSIRGHILDMEDVDQVKMWVENFVDDHQQIDVLINNVGGPFKRSAFSFGDLDLWRQTLDLNLLSLVSTTQSALPGLLASAKTRGDASVINISSISALHGGAGDSIHYASAKGAVITLTKGLAKELGPDRIRVNALVPSAIDTDFQRKHSSAERIQRIVDSTPLGRIGTVNDVANVALVLSDSEISAYVTGQMIGIDGGRS